MKTKKYKLYIALAVVLCIIVCLGILKTKNQTAPVTLNVSLYKVIPEYESFEKTVEECWKEKHPETALNFVNWDCYTGAVPEDLDVFVIDTLSLDAFADKGYLLALSEKDIQDYNDMIPSFIEGCRVDGTIYVVPQFLCTDLLYTRKEDADLKSVQNIDELHSALGDSGLLLEEKSKTGLICLYLQALTDEKQNYTDHYPLIGEGEISAEAADSLKKLKNMRLADPDGVPEDSGKYYYAQRFAEGMGRAYIGYSEAMHFMGERASGTDFRLFSMTDNKNIPVFYVDAAAVNAKISDEKRALALDLLNMITGRDMLTRALGNDGDPLYLLTSRYSVYDTLASDYPIYAELGKIASVPDAFVFRIAPDGDEYLKESGKNTDVLPSLSE